METPSSRILTATLLAGWFLRAARQTCGTKTLSSQSDVYEDKKTVSWRVLSQGLGTAVSEKAQASASAAITSTTA